MSSSGGFGGALRPSRGFNVNQAAAGSLDAAQQATRAGLGYRPAEISAQSYDPRGYNAAGYDPSTYNASTYDAAQVAGRDLNPYLNPYTTNVIDASMRDLGNAQAASLNQQGAQASAAGAFGGSRHGIADSATRLGYSQQAGDMANKMNLANYNNAMGLAQSDVSALNQAGQFNAGALNQAGQFNAGARNTAGAFNAGASNQANQFNAGNLTAANKYAADQRASAQSQNVANQFNANSARMNAANQLGNLSNTAFNQSQAIQNMQMKQGALQQAQQQAIYDAARRNFMGYTSSPQTSLNTMLAAMAGQPNQSTTTQQTNPGLFNYLQMGGNVAGAMMGGM